jgi:hypothetical protein
MNEIFRLRPSSNALCFVLCCCLLPFSASLFAADYPHTPIHRHMKRSSPATHATNASAALFEKNDAARALKLAQRETLYSPRGVNAWFLSMEAAHLLENQGAELRGALAVCALAKNADPRTEIAAMRLTALGQNSEPFRKKHEAIERLAGGDSACASAASEALYAAALDGLPESNVRQLAGRSGWLTEWTIARAVATNTKSQPEQLEFADGQVRLPDYFTPAVSYTAAAAFDAPDDATYTINAETNGGKISIDGREIAEREVVLSAGKHEVRVTFRGTERGPRIRIVKSAATRDQNAKVSHASAREIEYIRAAGDLAAGKRTEAIDAIRESELAATAVGLRLIDDATPQTQTVSAPALLPLAVVLAHPSCENVKSALDVRTNRDSQATLEEHFRSCGPDSIAYAQWLAASDRHLDAIAELNRLLNEWPLDREAHRLLVSELQRVGNNQAADRAAAEFLAIAPNARNFRRMAQNAALAHADASTTPFYEPYRRIAPDALPETSQPTAPVVILLQDKVAISRADGSVSMYMHRVVQLMTEAGAQGYRLLPMPNGAQLLTSRVVNRVAASASILRAGDEIEEEYVVNYTGDGGMISHPEAFQYVFNDFDSPLLDARFVILSPSNETPGYVIASGDVPKSRTDFANGYRAETWERKIESADANTSAPAIVRVVENENGWSIPPSVERRRILETIHPGPRPREA